MATDHVKVYEDKRGTPIWAWLLPLLLLLALLAWFLLHHHAANDAPAATATATAPAPLPTTQATAPGALAGMPDLGAVHFATNEATLTSDGTATLTRAAAYMKQNPNVHIRVEGYTDATGTDPHNLTLSQRRAATVEQFLQGQGVEKSRLTGEGFGPSNPVDSNATTNGKADNRRVELFQSQ